jgi:hypothetical protein
LRCQSGAEFYEEHEKVSKKCEKRCTFCLLRKENFARPKQRYQITILISANQEERPKIFKKFSKKILFGKKYYPVPQITPQIALTRKCFNRGHPNNDIQ